MFRPEDKQLTLEVLVHLGHNVHWDTSEPSELGALHEPPPSIYITVITQID